MTVENTRLRSLTRMGTAGPSMSEKGMLRQLWFPDCAVLEGKDAIVWHELVIV